MSEIISAQNQIERVQMWIGQSIVGNMLGMLEDFVRPCGQFPQVIRPKSLIMSSLL